MRFIIERGQLSSIKEDRFTKKDGSEGIAYYLIVKERVGDQDDEFATQIHHTIRIKENTDKVKFESYVGKVVSINGIIYSRRTKDNNSSFSNYVVECVEDIEIVE